MDYDRKFDPCPGRLVVDEFALDAVLVHLLGRRRVLRKATLSGGYRNTNILIETDGGSYVARCSQGQPDTVRVEAALLRHLDGVVPVPEVTAVYFTEQPSGFDLLLTAFVDGELLSEIEDDLTPGGVEAVGAALGNVAARIHAVRFAESGFFAPDLGIPAPFVSCGGAFLDHALACLASEPCKARLDPGAHRAASYFLEQNAGRLANLHPANRLVHSDFNSKNILVSHAGGQWCVAAILDWEFAHAGCPLTDLGNLLRFEDEQPAYMPAFADAYMAAGGELPPDWCRQAKLLDLVAMLSFLTEPVDRPKTFSTARRVIRRTIEGWASPNVR